MDNSSGVGVLDKAALVLSALESGPATLAGLVAATGLARPTAHRLAVALEHHRMVARDMQGRFILGPRLSELAAAAGEDRLLATAGPVLTHLRDVTGESAQLYRRQGDMRICVAAAERLSGLRDTVPVGSTLTMKAGSSAQILMAWEEPERLHRGLQGARFTATALSGVRRRGWAQSIGEREPGAVGGPGFLPATGQHVAAVVEVEDGVGERDQLPREPVGRPLARRRHQHGRLLPQQPRDHPRGLPGHGPGPGHDPERGPARHQPVEGSPGELVEVGFHSGPERR